MLGVAGQYEPARSGSGLSPVAGIRLSGQQQGDLGLQRVGVLELVDQDRAVAGAQAAASFLGSDQQIAGFEQQIVIGQHPVTPPPRRIICDELTQRAGQLGQGVVSLGLVVGLWFGRAVDGVVARQIAIARQLFGCELQVRQRQAEIERPLQRIAGRVVAPEPGAPGLREPKVGLELVEHAEFRVEAGVERVIAEDAGRKRVNRLDRRGVEFAQRIVDA